MVGYSAPAEFKIRYSRVVGNNSPVSNLKKANVQEAVARHAALQSSGSADARLSTDGSELDTAEPPGPK